MNLDFIKEVDLDLYKQMNELSKVLDGDIGPVVISQAIFHIGLKIFVEKVGLKSEFPDWVSHNWQPTLVKIITNESCKSQIERKIPDLSLSFLNDLIDKADFDKHQGFVSIDDTFRYNIFHYSYVLCSALYKISTGKDAPKINNDEIRSFCVSKDSYLVSIKDAKKSAENLQKSIDSRNVTINALNNRISELEKEINVVKEQINVSIKNNDSIKTEEINNSIGSVEKEIKIISVTEKQLLNLKQKEEKAKKHYESAGKKYWLIFGTMMAYLLLSVGGLLMLMISGALGGYGALLNNDHGLTRFLAWLFLIPLCINALMFIPSLVLLIIRIKLVNTEPKFGGDEIVGWIFLQFVCSLMIFFSHIEGINERKLQIERYKLKDYIK